MICKGIICDLDGAYFLNGKENFIKNVVAKYSVDVEIVRTLFFSSDIMLEYKRGKVSDEEYWQMFSSKLSIQASQEELIQLLVEGYEQDEKIVSLVRSFNDKGVKGIICSNNFPARVHGLNEKFGFLDNFSVHVFSYDVGSLKLEGFAMFEQVVTQTGLTKEEILLFDNGPENVRHAKEFGFEAFLYKDYLQLMEHIETCKVKL